jgi:hypothetical protein
MQSQNRHPLNVFSLGHAGVGVFLEAEDFFAIGHGF